MIQPAVDCHGSFTGWNLWQGTPARALVEPASVHEDMVTGPGESQGRENLVTGAAVENHVIQEDLVFRDELAPDTGIPVAVPGYDHRGAGDVHRGQAPLLCEGLGKPFLLADAVHLPETEAGEQCGKSRGDDGRDGVGAEPALFHHIDHGGYTAPYLPYRPQAFLVFKILIIINLALILLSLASGVFFLAKDDGKSNRVVTSLTVRVALSITLIVLLVAGFFTGNIVPHDIR